MDKKIKLILNSIFLSTILIVVSSCGDTSVGTKNLEFANISSSIELADTLYTTTIDISVEVKNSGKKNATNFKAVLDDPSGYLTYKDGTYPGTGGTCSNTVSSNSTCTIVFEFTPLVVGDFSSTLTLSFNDGIGNKELVLPFNTKGNDVAVLEIEYDPFYDFGVLNAGTPSTNLLVAITNIGETIATVMSGTIPAPFEFTGGSNTYPGGIGNCGISLEPEDTCFVEVYYTSPAAPIALSIEDLEIPYFDGLSAQLGVREFRAQNQDYVTIDTPTIGTNINFLNHTAMNFSGTCSLPGGNVDIRINGANLTSVACSIANTWSTVLDFTPIADGPVTVSADHSTATQDVRNLIKDIIPPTPPASGLGWLETSPNNTLTVNANWTPSSDGDVVSQTIRIYLNSSCTTPQGTITNLAPATSSFTFNSPGDADYYYQITSTDDVANTALSPCSLLMRVDTTPPVAPSTLAWAQASPANSVPVTPTWTQSISTDVMNQTITYYTDAACSVPSGVSNTIAAAAGTDSFTPPADGIYFYTVTARDFASNEATSTCVSTGMDIDTTPPVAASVIAWTGTSPTNNPSLTATWSVSSSSDVVTQQINFFSDAGCTTSTGANVTLPATTTNSYNFAGTDGIVYYYYITSIDDASNATTSLCSPAMDVDTTDPADATGLGWVETSPSSSLAVNASWTPSTDPELNQQVVTFYSDGTCTSPEGTVTTVGAGVTSTILTVTDGNTYSYTVESEDLAGNTITSPCSGSILIDTSPPVAANTLNWLEGSYHNATTVNSTWVVSTSTDVASQEITYFDDNTCTNIVSGPIVLASASTAADTFTLGVDGTSYYYRVNTIDNAGNNTLSVCSNSVLVDTTAPSPVTLTGWTQVSPTASASVDSNWNLSASTDIQTTSIEYFTDPACSTTAGTFALSNSAITHNYTPASDGTYYYNVTVIDFAGNSSSATPCSAVIEVDTTAPAAASALAWTQTSPFNSLTVDASWTPSVDGDLTSQVIQYYTNPTCSVTSGAAIPLGAGISTNNFTGSNGQTYYYTINSIDDVGNNTVSACSLVMRLDTTAPNAATGLAWAQSTPFNSVNITANWTLSTSGDIASQTIVYYTDAACGIAEGTTAPLSNTDTTHSFTGSDANDYYYQITTTDNASNSTLSNCSLVMSIDTTPPTAPTGLGWLETTPVNNTTINASWSLSASGDIASQSIQFYTDVTCSTTTGSNISLGAGVTTRSFIGSTGNDYYYIVSATDTAGNTTASNCSLIMSIDTTPPSVATALTWVEGTANNITTVTPTWTTSPSTDLNTQTVTYYTDPTCSTPESTVNVLGNSVNTDTFTGVDGGVYYYTVTSEDNATNTAVSTCSSIMTIDTSAPAAPTGVAWAQTSPHNALTVTAQWVVSSSPDVDFQTIRYYTDVTCSTAQGTTATLLSTDTSHSFTGTDGGDFYFTIEATDFASNSTTSICSSLMELDTTNPLAVTGLNWTQITPHNATSIDANWTLSGSPDIASYDVQFYTDASCTTTTGAVTNVSNATVTRNFTGADGTTYYFDVTAIDTADNTTKSLCSTVMLIDTSAPAVATVPVWSEVSPHDATTVTASWTLSTATDIASQEINVYTDNLCAGAIDATTALSNSATTHVHTGADATDYYYTITTIDNAGNTSLSACSTIMSIDTTFPAPPTAITWVEASPHNALTVTSSWVLSASGDIASQRVDYFTDALCTIATGLPVPLTAGITTNNFTGTDGGDYSYKVIATDTAGNSTASTCSTIISLDVTAPNIASGLIWAEGATANSFPINPNWTKSTSGDLADQEINIYQSPTCGGAAVETGASLGSVANSYVYNTGVSNNQYSYTITSTDTAGNTSVTACSTSIYTDTTPPANATSLGWTQTSPFSGSAVDAAWTVSTDPDLASQSIQFYSDNSCGTNFGVSISLTAAINTYNLTGVTNTNDYSYTITSTDAAGNSDTSGCSLPILIDTTAPTGASVLAWTEGAYDTDLSVNATWTDSSDGDEASETINIYENNACSGAVFATSSLAANTGAFNFTSGSNGNTYYFEVVTTDTAGNPHTSTCSTGITLDTTAPTAANALGWSEATPSGNLTVTASWTLGGSGDVASQSVQFHDNGTCSSATGAPIPLGAAVTTQTFTGVTATTYSYRVTTTDNAGNNTNSLCSSSMVLDTDDPTAPTATAWLQSSPTNLTTITSQWTLGGSADVASHRVNYYTDPACGTSAGAPVAKNATDTNDNFTGANGVTYYYTVTAIDNAGNTATSACVAGGLTVDTDAPLNATILSWTQTSPHSGVSIDSSWTLSTSGDIASQSIQYYVDGTCTIADGAPVSLTNVAITHNRSATDSTTYSYTITTVDNATNASTSLCSTSLLIDTTSPLAANTLAWVEGTPSASTSVNSTWTRSTSTDIASQTVNYFTNGTCAAAAASSFTIGAAATTHNLTGAINATTYSYNITTTDNAGNTTDSTCSASTMTIDTDFPNAPTAPAWAQSTPYNATSITAGWTLGGSGDIANHRVEYFNDGTCAGSVASSNTVAAIATSNNFTGTNTTTHSFKVVAIDNAGNETASICSNPILIDTDAPLNASTLTWSEGATSNTSPINPTWVASTSTDVASQIINIYQSTTCGGVAVDTSAALADNITTYSFAGAVSNNDYSYTITTTDDAGNVSISSCSASIFIDINPPANATGLGWAQTSPFSGSTINANWTASVSPDLASQSIQFYADGTCTAAQGSAISLSAATIAQSLPGVTDTNTYSYKITSTDATGNSDTSGCSLPMLIDTTAPTGASVLAWTEGAYDTDLSVNATWTDSSDGDEASETINIYENNVCSGTIFATSSLAANTGAFNFTSGSNGNTYYFEVVTTDTAGNPHTSTCSTGITLDTTAPTAANALGWSEATPSGNLTVTASWTLGGSGDVASQSVQFHDNGTCSSATGAPIPLGAAVTTQTFTGVTATTYSYRVTTTDNAGNNTNSLCSSSMLLDSDDPIAPNATAWSQGTLTNTTTITSQWTLGGSADVASHRVNYYTDPACGTSAGAPVAKTSTDTDDNFTGANGLTYYYTVTAIDNAGNTATSACVAAGITIDTSNPNNATTLAWTQTSPTNVTAIQASWIKSTSGDINDQLIEYFADGTCTISLGAPASIGSVVTTDTSVTGVHGTTYSYKITTVDNATNSSTSGCSGALRVDTVGPTVVAPGSLAWTQTSPSSTISVDSTWTASTSPDTTSESISYFTNPSCTPAAASGPFVVGPTAGTHNFATGATGNTYYFQITSTDGAGNSTVSACSAASMTLDTDFPTAANTIAWAQSTPYNLTGITATWALGGSGDVANHRVQYYNDGTCAGSVASSSVEASGATSASFTGTNATTHSFKVITIDGAGNETASTCSNLILIDTTAPNDATTLVWTQGATSNTSPVTASWAASTSTDVASQVVNVYQSNSCGGVAVDTSAVLADNATSFSFAGAVSNNEYTYTVTTTDDAGNVSVSPCSSSIFIDINPPSNATALDWVESSPFNGSTVTANWTPSVSADLASQSIQFYSDGTCVSSLGSSIGVSSATTTQSLAGVTNANSYSYKITSFDSAGNSDTSGCSSAILIDTVPPTGASGLAWTEGAYDTDLSVNATWTSSNDGDEADETINIYENNSCSGAVFATNSLPAGTGAYNFTTGSNGNDYYFEIVTADGANATHTTPCSTPIRLDTTAPTAANSLVWTTATPSNNLTVTASWTLGGSGDVASQSIQFHDNGTCSSATGAPIPLGAAVTTQTFTGVTATTYSYRVTTTDNAGNNTNSLCSSSMLLDTDDPIAPNATAWSQGTLTNTTTITSQWTLGGSADVASHTVEYFTDPACGTSAGAPVSKTSTDTDDNFTGANGLTYYYKVTATDNAGNTATSACVAAGITIDTSNPNNATTLAWTQTSPTNVTAIQASWIKSTSGDINDQLIEYFADGTCTTSLGAAASIGSVVTTDTSVTGVHGTTYSYKITTVDNATNSSTSGCSGALRVDTVGPNVVSPGTLAWTQTSPSSNLSVDTTWTASTSPDTANESVSYFTDSSCTPAAAAGPFVVAAGAGTHNFATGASGNTYYFQITSTDTAGNSTVSACSVASMTLDTDFPTAANTIAWGESSPHNATGITATWILGGSGDVANHRVQYYNDGTCAGSVASTATVSNITTSNAFTGTNAATHSFKVVTIDGAGNETLSTCSNPVTIDTDAPNNAASLAWAEGTSTSATTLNANWVASTSTDVADQVVNIYQSNSCGGVAVETSAALADNITAYAFTSPLSNNSYTYTITTTDDAGNVSVSPCSGSIYTDSTPPANATSLGWTQTSPFSGSSITASWTKSVDPDLASQTIQVYSDGTCTTPFGTSVALTNAAITHIVAGVTDTNTYTYKITSRDAGANSDTSGCSLPMLIDTTAPTGASVLAWTEGAYDTDLSVNATWTSSNDGDEADETINIYENNVCSGAVFNTSTLASGTGAYNFTTGSNGNDYYFEIVTTDTAGNPHTTTCSTAIRLDTTAPTAANTLGWSEATPSGNLTVNASWTLGGSGDVASQSVQFHDNGTCSSATGAPVSLGAAVTTTPFTGVTATTYSYRVTTTDSAGNSTASLCSSSMVLDTDDPIAPNATAWSQGTLTNTTTITSQWTLGGSADVASHTVEYFTDPACGTSAGAPVAKTSTDTDDNFTGANGNTYYYKVTATDNAGNTATSACVAAGITIDTTNPNNATALVWTQTTPHNTLSIDSSWTLSASGDVASQSIQYYADGTCTTADGPAVPLGDAITTHNRAATNGSTYTYTITTIDDATNSSTSGCSSALTIDNAAPTAPNTLAWVESSPSPTTSVNSTWSVSPSGDIASQTITYYTDACTTSVSSVVLAAGIATHNFTGGVSGNTYFFDVTATDTANNSTTSACSPTSITLDTDFPTAANTIAWAQSSPYNLTGITATWALGGSGDVANHRVQYYNDGTCAGSVASSSIEALGATSASFTGTNTTTHSFKVITIDAAGNETSSLCSNSILIDADAPNNATVLAWTEGTSSNTSPVNASWIASTSTDVASQVVNVYQSNSCGGGAVATSAALADNITTYSFAGAVSNNDYTYTVTTTDDAGNVSVSTCSSSIFIDINPPSNATSLGWVESSPYSGSTVNASWTPSVSADLASQTLQFYSDGTCTTPLGSAIAVSAATNNQSLPGVSDTNSYSYNILSVDNAGNSDTSLCSSVITIDTQAPTGATAFAWVESSPNSGLSINAGWTSSNDGDEASEVINIYENDASCSGAIFATASLAAGTGAYNFTTGSDTNRYSFRVVTADGAGNAHTTNCSSQILLDLAAPTAANTLGWIQSTPSSSLTVTAQWTLGGSVDVASQDIQFYDDGICSSTVGGAVSVGPGVTTRSFTGLTATTYSYIVTTIDNANNSTASICSDAIALDNVGPTAPAATAWAQGTVTNSTAITSQWTLGGSPDVASHRVNYYTDALCGVSAGAPVAKTATDTSDNFTGANGLTYYYTVTAIDTAGNETASACVAAGILVDTSDPDDATLLGWTQSNPHNSTSIDAAWTLSTSGDIASQSIQYYADGTCTTADGAPIPLGNAITTHNKTGVSGTTYSYTIRTIDNATNSSTSGCSDPMKVDTNPPLAALAMNWVETSPYNNTSVNSVWTPSASADVASETVNYYDNATCIAPILSSSIVGAAAGTHNFTGVDGNIYSYTITTADNAGNTVTSACSSVTMTIDTGVPTAPTLPVWSEGTLHNSLIVTASWALGGSGDVTSHRIDYYNNATCTGAIASSDTAGSGDTTDSFSGTNTVTHSFKVTALDAAGNAGTSACSAGILIDTTDPSDATALTWSEGTSSNTSPVEAAWTISGSGDLASQTINIYTDSACGGVVTETSALTDSDNTYSFTSAVSNNSYTYQIVSLDDAGNTSTSACSASIYIDINPPTLATGLGWVQTDPYSGATIDAAWTISTSPDLGSQTIQVFSDGTCTTPFGAAQVLANNVATLTVSGVTDSNTYSYTILSKDTAGNSTPSACSSSLSIDTLPPSGATTISWAEGAYDTDLSVNALWTSSTDGDETNEIIKIYENDATCSGAPFTSVTLAANTGAYNFTTGSSDNDYRFTVTTTDGANDHVTGCSAAIRVDTNPPVAQTARAWIQSNPHSGTALQASWIGSISTDVASQEIQFYNDGVCTGGNEEGAKITGLGSGVTTQSLTGTTGTTYSYILTVIDNAGNSTDSACSSPLKVDTDNPLAPSGLSWFETSPHDALSVTAQWTLSASGDIASQRIDYYIVAGCGGGASATSTTASGATTDIFSGINGNTYYFTVTAIDGAGNEGTSACIAGGMTLDTTAPATATGLGWTESTPTSEATLNPTWTRSAAGDIANQKIEYFTNVSCGATTGVINTLSNVATTDAFTTAVHNTTYYYKISTEDNAGNITVSGCSSGLAVDYVDPDPATAATLADEWVSGSTPLSSPIFGWTNPVTTFNKMEVALGTTSGDDDISTWSSVASATSTIFSGVTPPSECSLMYPSVRSVDAAGNTSTVLTYASGLRWDNTNPTNPSGLNFPNDDSTTTDSATLSWSAASDNCLLSNYEVAVSTTVNYGGVVPGGEWQDVGTVTSFQVTGLALSIDTDYYVLVRAVDAAGNRSTIIPSAAFQNNSPPYALIKGAETTAPGADRFNFNNFTEEEVIFSLSSRIDGAYFAHDTETNAHELTVKVAGDYYISYNSPLESPSVGGGQRVVIANDIYINGVLQDDFRTNSAYIRYADDQTQATNAMGSIVTLAANDVITLTTKGTSVTGNIVSNNTSLYVEFIKPGRTIFKATATQTTAGTDYNQAAAAALEWSSVIKDAGFTHNNGASPENITLATAGTYKVTFNVPFQHTGGCPASAQRTLVRVRARLDGINVPSAVGAEGYIRCASNFVRSSSAWTGYIKTTAPNQVLSITTQQATNSGDPLYALVDGTTREATLSVELVDSSSDTIVLYGNSVATGTNWGANTTPTAVEWNTQDEIDSSVFTHSTGANSHQITVSEDGDYLVNFSVWLDRDTQVGSVRSNIVIKVQVNGNNVSGGECSSLYARNQNSGGENHFHLEATCKLELALANRTAGDVISFTAHRETGPNVTRQTIDDAQLVITKKR